MMSKVLSSIASTFINKRTIVVTNQSACQLKDHEKEIRSDWNNQLDWSSERLYEVFLKFKVIVEKYLSLLDNTRLLVYYVRQLKFILKVQL